MRKKTVVTPDERHIHSLCGELDRCHQRFPNLRVEGFAFAGESSLCGDSIEEVWNAIFSDYANLDEDVVVIPERWRRSQSGQYAYRFFGDPSGCDDFSEIEQEVHRVLNVPDATSRGGSGVFLAGAIGLRCQLPMLGVRLGYAYLDHDMPRTAYIVEGDKLPPSPPERPACFRLELKQDPFFSLKIALEWLLTPSPPKSVPGGWKALGRLPYAGYVEGVLVSGRGIGGKLEGKVSRTQAEVDEVIGEYKAKRASSYSELVARVKAGNEGAKKAAREMFGRNVIVRELRIKCAAMVTRSPVWIAIAEELRIPHGRKAERTSLKHKRGMEIAIGTTPDSSSSDPLTVNINRETVNRIRRRLPGKEHQAAVDAIIEQLECGKITADDAEATVEQYLDQSADDRHRKVHSTPSGPGR